MREGTAAGACARAIGANPSTAAAKPKPRQRFLNPHCFENPIRFDNPLRLDTRVFMSIAPSGGIDELQTDSSLFAIVRFAPNLTPRAFRSSRQPLPLFARAVSTDRTRPRR